MAQMKDSGIFNIFDININIPTLTNMSQQMIIFQQYSYYSSKILYSIIIFQSVVWPKLL